MAQMRAKLRALLVGTAAALTAGSASAATLTDDAETVCNGLVGGTDAVKIDSATLLAPSQLAVAERGPTPSGRITPANPRFCKVLGHIDPADPRRRRSNSRSTFPSNGTGARCNMAAAVSTAC